MYDEMEHKSKMSSLMDLVKEMKRLQSEGVSGKPKAMAIEVHAEKALPLESIPAEAAEMAGDHEPSDHEDMADHGDDEECEDEDEEHEDMHLPEGLSKLLSEKLGK